MGENAVFETVKRPRPTDRPLYPTMVTRCTVCGWETDKSNVSLYGPPNELNIAPWVGAALAEAGIAVDDIGALEWDEPTAESPKGCIRVTLRPRPSIKIDMWIDRDGG